MDMHIGDKVDVLNIGGRWVEGIVLGVEQTRVKIKYLMCGDVCCEWIMRYSERLNKLGSSTYQPEEGVQLRQGHEIEAQDKYGNWYESIITEVKDEMIKLHYYGRSIKNDEWIPNNSARIRKYSTI
jgi:hypothetical protein